MKKWFLIVFGTVTWSLTMIKSGLIYKFGMGFWGANGHDGIWHLALIESLSRGNFQMPVFSGSNLQNYHLGFDLLIAAIHKLTSIPSVTLYFQIAPVILAFLIGLLTYKFVFLFTKSERSSLLATFFVYFGGSFGWILGKGESAFWSQQAISTLINPPFALSLIFILLGMIFLQNKKIFFSILCFGILVQIKIYAGILVLGGLLVSGIYGFIFYRNLDLAKVFFGSVIISLIFFLPFNKLSSNLLIFQPFWFLETMMGLSDRIGWNKFYSAMTNYKLGHVWLKGVLAYLSASVIFWVGNMGLRIIKELLVWKWVRNIRNLTWIEIFISSVVVGGGIIPMLFLQKGTPWNTIQFFYYSLFFSSILAGISIDQLLNKFKNIIVIRIVVVGIILLTIPTTIFTLKDVYIPSRPPAMIPNNELSALGFLSTQPDGTILTYPYDAVMARDAIKNPPRPLYLYESTGYVSAFTNHQTFLEDQVNLDITGHDWQTRLNEVQSWYQNKNEIQAREFLLRNNIKYIYWIKPQRALLGEKQLGLRNIYENPDVIVYSVEQPHN